MRPEPARSGRRGAARSGLGSARKKGPPPWESLEDEGKVVSVVVGSPPGAGRARVLIDWRRSCVRVGIRVRRRCDSGCGSGSDPV